MNFDNLNSETKRVNGLQNDTVASIMRKTMKRHTPLQF